MGATFESVNRKDRLFFHCVFACAILFAAAGGKAFATTVVGSGQSGGATVGQQVPAPQAGAPTISGQAAGTGTGEAVLNVLIDKIDGRNITAKDGSIYQIPEGAPIINNTRGGKATVLQLNFTNGVIAGAMIR